MKASTQKKWVPMVGVLVAIIGSFAALMYLSISSFSTDQGPAAPTFNPNQPDEVRHGRTSIPMAKMAEPALSPLGNSKIILRLNRRTRVGKALMTYRGLEGQSTFRLDVIVPELDAKTTYSRKMRMAEARRGFQAGGQHFELLSAGKSKIRLLYHAPPP